MIIYIVLPCNTVFFSPYIFSFFLYTNIEINNLHCTNRMLCGNVNFISRWSNKEKCGIELFSVHGKQKYTSLNDFKTQSVRSSHWRCSVKKGVPKNFVNFTGNHLCWSLFLIKLQASQDSNTGVFLWNLRNF